MIESATLMITTTDLPLIAVHGIRASKICKCSKGSKCSSPGKHPLGNWRTNPKTPVPGDNVGVPTGPESGVWVLDVDAKGGGMESIAALIHDNDMPRTLVAMTGGGGVHYYFKWPTEQTISNSVRKIAEGVDVRGAGGFVVAPPSVNASGPYAWVDDTSALADAPDWLLALVIGEPEVEHETVDLSAYMPHERLQRAIGYARQMEPATEGEGGDSQTFQVASIGHSFGVPETDWLEWMTTEYNPKCNPPWEPDDLADKVSNGYHYGDRPIGWRLDEVREVQTQAPASVSEPGQTQRLVFDSFGDIEIARQWLKQTGRQIREIEGGLYLYADGFWGPVTDEEIQGWAHREVNGAWLNVGDKSRAMDLQIGKRDSIVRALYREVEQWNLRAHESEFIPGVAFENGTAVMGDGQLRLVPHSPDVAVRQRLPIEFDAGAACPNTLAILRETFAGVDDTEERLQLLQEFFGVAMMGHSTSMDKALIVTGNGSNGKSTICMALAAALFSDDKVTNVLPDTLRDPQQVIRLRGSLVNWVDDMEERAWIHTGTLKSVVSGSIVTGRRIYQSAVHFYPSAGHVFSANALPAVADGTHGLWRRMMVLEFPNQFGERGRRNELVDAITSERQGVVRWAMEGGARAITNQRYTIPSSAAAAAGEWRDNSDAVARFMAECTEKNAEGLTSTGDLYSDFCVWYSDQSAGDKIKVHKNRFSQKLEALGYEKKRSSTERGFAVVVKNKTEWPDYGA